MRPGKAPLPYQDGRRDLTAMPEHKRGRGDFTVVPGTQGWQGRPYCHSRNTREVGEILLSYQEHKDSMGRPYCHARNTREVEENFCPTKNTRMAGETLLSYQEYKDGRRQFTVILEIQ
jgi:hypothetical protein